MNSTRNDIVNPVDSSDQCKLIAGWFAILLQVGIIVIAIGTLVLKRQFEKPRRSLVVWSFDASKQAASAIVGRIANLLLSIAIAASLPVGSDECLWYFINFMSDVLIGTFINFVLLALFDQYLDRYCPTKYVEYLRFGSYGSPPSFYYNMLPQLLVWVLIVLSGKGIILLSIIFILNPLNYAGDVIFSSLDINKYKEVELIVVMIIFPIIFNSLKVWLTDAFLKLSSNIAYMSFDSNDNKRRGSSLSRVSEIYISLIKEGNFHHGPEDFNEKENIFTTNVLLD